MSLVTRTNMTLKKAPLFGSFLFTDRTNDFNLSQFSCYCLGFSLLISGTYTPSVTNSSCLWINTLQRNIVYIAMTKAVTYPELEISKLDADSLEMYRFLMDQSHLNELTNNIEVWTTSASNRALAYHSHGIVRYFGKFPPPIARHLITTYTKKGHLVIDPMCGSGTTALESLLLDRKALCIDVNPLSVLLSTVKSTYIDEAEFNHWLDKLIKFVETDTYQPWHKFVGLKNPQHWFLEETVASLSKIKYGIKNLGAPEHIENALYITFVGIIRRVSRATSQQGRLFLDVVTAEKDALPFFIKKAKANAKSLSTIPKDNSDIRVLEGSLMNEKELPNEEAELLICHPPYFNNYKYSGVYSLELSWMDYDHGLIRKSEVREAFKIGKPEKMSQYLDDMEKALINCHKLLKKRGVMGLMIGDTILRNKYLPVTKLLIDRVSNLFDVELVSLRVPQFTEASWAASQRRLGDKVGVSLSDFVVILRKK